MHSLTPQRQPTRRQRPGEPVDGRDLPQRIDVRYGDNRYARLNVKSFAFAAPK